MPACQVCNGEYERVATFCPNCGAPLPTLAARIREAGARPAVIGAKPDDEAPADDDVVVPEAEERFRRGRDPVALSAASVVRPSPSAGRPRRAARRRTVERSG